jgi:CRP/FNR family transcriptional regulator
LDLRTQKSGARSPTQPRRHFTPAAVVELLHRGCWASLPLETVASLTEGGRLIEFPAARTIYSEADAEGLAVVLQGLLRVYMHAGDGRQVTVRYVRAGDLLGVPAMVGGPAPVFVRRSCQEPRSASTATASGAPHKPTRRLPGSSRNESVHRLYDVLEELAGNTFATVRQRVARHLLDLAASQPAAAGPLTALVSQQDLANSVGSVREVIARVLAELRADRLIRTSPGRVEILDPVRMSRELWSRA